MISLHKKQTYQVIFIDSDGLTLYEFTKVNNIIELVNSREIEEKESLHFNKAICVINTKDVLTSKTQATTLDKAFDEVFPAFRKADLYIDFQQSEVSQIAIIKKEKLIEVLNHYNISSLYPLQIRLGSTVCSIENLSGQNSAFNSKIAELAVASLITEQSIENNLDGVELRFRESRKNKRLFEIMKWSAILVFLVGLLINFYFHEYYRKELGLIQQQLVSINKLDEDIEQISNKIKTKEFLLRSDNANDINTLRYLNNHLAATGKVALDQLTYQPLRSGIENNEELKLYNQIVWIIGKASSKGDFNDYVNRVEKLKSIKKVEIISVEETAKNILFELQIQLEDEVR